MNNHSNATRNSHLSPFTSHSLSDGAFDGAPNGFENTGDNSGGSTFPSYQDAMSGNVPFPDLPLLSQTPFIIAPPPMSQAGYADVDVQFRVATSKIGQNVSDYRIQQLIDRNARSQIESIVNNTNRGVRQA